ncbi:hypothetical protein KSX_59800 [Ktedonospora formicarum]|uniref:histidine kinase n=1 Tax=Ktedonospora formicarum TaxID=2778364 RepID=A0A8J3MT45_9CHLR|nr:hypothetical protein KSX_59800 [Ktedonospora formicarum]
MTWLWQYNMEPGFLPFPLRHLAIGYGLALVLPCVAGFLAIVLLQLVPQLQFSESLILLAILLISSCWGLLPGLLASFVGIAFYLVMLLPPRFPFVIEARVDIFSTVMFTLTSLCISLLTSQLQRARLQAQQAQGEAERAKQMMDDFLSMITHELLTPLTASHLSLQIIKHKMKQRSPTQVAERVAREHFLQVTIERALHQLDVQQRLVYDLLDASRIRSKGLELSTQRCDLGEIVRNGVEVQRLLHPERTLLLTETLNEIIPVEADPDRVHQALGNYLSNALKYSAPDTPVSVSVTRTPSHVRVSVSDHGPGLTAEQQQEVWKRFYRAPGISVQSGSSVSLGLGLHIARNVIERLGGQVGIQSNPSQGSTFWFCLPLTYENGSEERMPL